MLPNLEENHNNFSPALSLITELDLSSDNSNDFDAHLERQHELEQVEQNTQDCEAFNVFISGSGHMVTSGMSLMAPHKGGWNKILLSVYVIHNSKKKSCLNWTFINIGFSLFFHSIVRNVPSINGEKVKSFDQL